MGYVCTAAALWSNASFVCALLGLGEWSHAAWPQNMHTPEIDEGIDKIVGMLTLLKKITTSWQVCGWLCACACAWSV